MGSIKDRNGMDLTEAEDIKKRVNRKVQCFMTLPDFTSHNQCFKS